MMLSKFRVTHSGGWTEFLTQPAADAYAAGLTPPGVVLPVEEKVADPDPDPEPEPGP